MPSANLSKNTILSSVQALCKVMSKHSDEVVCLICGSVLNTNTTSGMIFNTQQKGSVQCTQCGADVQVQRPSQLFGELAH